MLSATQIKALRRSLRLSQQAFADRIGVAWLTVSRWENGHFRPSVLAQRQIQGILCEILPDSHHVKVAHLGVWDYRIAAPTSMDDPAEVRIVVQYGQDGPQEQAEYLFCLRGKEKSG